MLSLLKIRVKYIIRNPCLLFWTYLCLPIIIAIVGAAMFAAKDEIELETYESRTIAEKKIFLGNMSQYEHIFPYLQYTGFLVPKQADCDIINSIVEPFQSNKPKCSDKESSFNEKINNIIKIEENGGKYKVDLDMERHFGKSSTYLFFEKDDLDQDYITDPYYKMDLKDPGSYHNMQLPNDAHIFFELQSLISRILIGLKGKEIGKHNFEMYFGYNKYPTSYKFVDIESMFAPHALICFVFVLQFSLVNYNINMRMISEKEAKLDILLERQGISYFKYMLSWLFTHMTLFLTSIVSFSVLCGQQSNGHFYLFIINLIIFPLSLFFVSAFFTACFKTVKNGSTAIKFYNFGSIFLGFAIILPKTIKFTKIFFAFIPQINFFMNYWSTICLGNFEKLSGDLVLLRAAKMSYIETFIMFFVEIIFYFLLTYIIHSYKQSGLTFCLYLKSCFTHVSRNINNGNLLEENVLNVAFFDKHFQELSETNRKKLEANQCLKIVNVSKSFDDLKAVKNFSGELFTDEIYCLLGHNGAGKTTLINMISGIYDPNEGDILLDGRSIVTDKKYLYENIGLCQQEDIFFEHLTVEEHLEYMCKIKGSQVNQQEINELITKIDLAPKRTALCKTLSGGQKRKLCIALALIGNSKIILLDEPTSGMDIMARRQLWEFLKNYKKEKIILLTTHFLDEAEYLGDRIGIMLDGQYMCCGSSSFLKSKYPCGFNINLIINSQKFDDNKKTQFYREMKKYEEKAEIKVNSKSVFSVNIRQENKSIKEIFDYIENCKEEFGITDYTVGSTSLEDVFLKLSNKSNINEINIFDKSPIIQDILPEASSFCTQFCAHVRRNLYPFYRNKLLFFFELLAGLGAVYIFLIFFSDLLLNQMNGILNLGEVLQANQIYVHTSNTGNNFFENSDVYNRYGSYISLYEINDEDTSDFEKFRELAYDKSLAHIAKGAINVKRENNNGYYNYTVYNSEIYNGKCGYIFANTMLMVSAFLKESYGIDATILDKIVYKTAGEVENAGELLYDSIVLIIVCLLNFFGYVIFIAGLMHEKIKEKRTHIKHLLYLSGNKILSYWLGFYVADYLKLLVFTILLVAPLYTINGCATYFAVDLLIINIGALSFIYFIGSLCSKEEEGTKVLFSLIFSVLLFLIWLSIIAATNDFINQLINLLTPLVPSVYDITPFTSMAYSFVKMIISYSIFSEYEKRHGGVINVDKTAGFLSPGAYLASSYIAQILNIIFYTILLVISESGCFGRLGHKMEQCYADEDIKTVPVPTQAINYNNIMYNPNTNYNIINNSNSSINNTNIINNNNINNNFTINDDNSSHSMKEPLVEQLPIEENEITTNQNLLNSNSNLITNQQNNYGQYQNNQVQYQNNQYQPPSNQMQYQNQNNQIIYQKPSNQVQYQNNQYQPQNNQVQYQNNQYQPQNNQVQYPNSQAQYPNNQYQPQNNQVQYPNNQAQYPNNQYQPLNNQAQYPNNQIQYQNQNNQVQYQNNQVQYPNNQIQNQNNQNRPMQYQNPNNQIQFPNNQIQYQNPNNQLLIQNQNQNQNLINTAQINQPENLDINLHGENFTGNPLFNPYVQSEIKKVNSQQNLSTRIINLTKTFYPCCSCCKCCRKNKVRAINHLHLGLEENEKFGLLGFNGSGKTTTFRAITNEIMTDFGSINIFGYDTKTQFNSIRTMVGYCPQINPLFDFMKVKEIIQFYSKLKTYNKTPEEVCTKFGLTKYMDTFTVNLSGGNKRKLTFAIALMNKPTLLLLDEPSTGVDPESRRIMWRNINELSNSGHKYNMILTTHSMEEAEMLCDTVSWFRDGNFITLGNPEQLKLKYSAGYKLHIKFVESEIKSQFQEEDLEKSYNEICSLVNGFNNYSNFIRQYTFFEIYIKALIKVIQRIKDKTKKISLYTIRKDYSFDLVIKKKKKKKKELFTDILNLKNDDKSIEEMSVGMQSLENILTSL